jgi:hypothetical protein
LIYLSIINIFYIGIGHTSHDSNDHIESSVGRGVSRLEGRGRGGRWRSVVNVGKGGGDGSTQRGRGSERRRGRGIDIVE